MTLSIPETIRVLLPGGSVRKLDMEAYVRGVVGAALPHDAPIEALKAQAVAARTFGSITRRHIERGADVCTLRHCQVWKESDTGQGLTATEETRGIVAVHSGRLIDAYYFDHCDGNTRDATGILPEVPPYLKSVTCPCGFATLKGHGIGMCQRGALVLARYGDPFDVILKHYFNGITLEKAIGLPVPSPEAKAAPAAKGNKPKLAPSLSPKEEPKAPEQVPVTLKPRGILKEPDAKKRTVPATPIPGAVKPKPTSSDPPVANNVEKAKVEEKKAPPATTPTSVKPASGPSPSTVQVSQNAPSADPKAEIETKKPPPATRPTSAIPSVAVPPTTAPNARLTPPAPESRTKGIPNETSSPAAKPTSDDLPAERNSTSTNLPNPMPLQTGPRVQVDTRKTTSEKSVVQDKSQEPPSVAASAKSLQVNSDSSPKKATSSLPRADAVQVEPIKPSSLPETAPSTTPSPQGENLKARKVSTTPKPIVPAPESNAFKTSIARPARSTPKPTVQSDRQIGPMRVTAEPKKKPIFRGPPPTVPEMIEGPIKSPPSKEGELAHSRQVALGDRHVENLNLEVPSLSKPLPSSSTGAPEGISESHSLPPLNGPDRGLEASSEDETGWYPVAEDMIPGIESLRSGVLDYAFETPEASEDAPAEKATPKHDLGRMRETTQLPPANLSRAQIEPFPLPKVKRQLHIKPAPQISPDPMPALVPQVLPPERPSKPPPPAPVEERPSDAKTSVQPKFLIDRLPGPRSIAGDLDKPGVIITIQDSKGNAVVTVSGTAPHFGAGGFEAPLSNAGIYNIVFDHQSVEVDLRDETVILTRSPDPSSTVSTSG